MRVHDLLPKPAGRRPGASPIVASPSPRASSAAVRQVLHGPHLQPKLTVGSPGDAYEQEADRVADAMMRMPEPEGRVQRMCPKREEKTQRQPAPEKEEDEDKTLQAKETPEQIPEVTPDVESRIAAFKDSGQPLPSSERAFIEPRFGWDFGNVRLNTSCENGTRWQRAAPAAGTASLRAHHTGPTIQRLGDLKKIPSDLSCEVAPNSPEPVVDNIMFENRISALSDLNRQQIENFVRNWRAAGANQTVRVDGFASSPGTDELNWRLSRERAQAVAEVLMHPSAASGLEGIPNRFISVFMHGETSELGVEAENRRATLALFGGGSPPPPTPTPTPTTGPTEENCRRARQVECVIRLGGCPNTRPGGIPEPEEIERYNSECRDETGYQGPAVTPTTDECVSGSASPPPEECRNARLEETHICGPNISQPLADVLADVRSTFGGWSTTQQREACSAITGVPLPFVSSGFIMAWDIHNLFLPETGWLCGLPYHGPCGRPPATDCDDEDSADCGNSVEVNNKCFLAGTVNYALLGQICRLCNDQFGMLSESTMENLILGWKALRLLLDDPGPPTAWARAGFHGFPGHIPTLENRGHCRGRCPVTYSSGPFTWVWEPLHPR